MEEKTEKKIEPKYQSGEKVKFYNPLISDWEKGIFIKEENCMYIISDEKTKRIWEFTSNEVIKDEY